MRRPRADKEVARKLAILDKKKVLWKGPDNLWRWVSGYEHVPGWAVEVEGVDFYTLVF
jgi:hypothetical protein